MNETRFQFYTSNPDIWDGMIDACKQATSTIDFEIFIFMPDEIGKRFIDVCAQKAAQGVKVRFIWDAAGSFSFFGSTIIDELKKKGIELTFFQTLLPNIFSMHDYKSWYFRNHRRTLVIDGKIGITGSTCIGKKYENWRETQVKVEGPVVADMQQAFNRMWHRAQGKKLLKIAESIRSDVEFEYLTNNPIPKHRYLYRRILTAVRSAKRYIYITTPYFVPTHKLARVLILAAHRGVDIQIIIPERSDYPTVDLGARTFFHQMLKAGIRIHLYPNRMIHTKSIIIDDDWSTMGTLNLDHIALLYNFEANLVSTNKAFTQDLLSQFREDLKQTHEITLSEWNRRFFIEKIATFFVKFMRAFL